MNHFSRKKLFKVDSSIKSPLEELKDSCLKVFCKTVVLKCLENFPGNFFDKFHFKEKSQTKELQVFLKLTLP